MRSSDYIERREAAVRALSTAPGVRWDERILSGDASAHARTAPDSVTALVAEWLQDPARPTALITDNDNLAFSLIQALGRQDVTVPGDVSVCALAGAGVPAADGRRVTQSFFDFVGMGRKAVELLRLRCERPAAASAPATHRVGCEFVEGETACPP